MFYRIRYRQKHTTMAGEEVVEAHNPTEAMVKFRCTHPGESGGPAGNSEVVSVEEEIPDMAW